MTKRTTIFTSLAILIAMGGLHLTAQSKRAISAGVAELSYDTDAILMQPAGEFAKLILTVSGPEGVHFEQAFQGSESLYLELFDPEGSLLPDGSYTYKIVAQPFEVMGEEGHDNGRGEDIDFASKRDMGYDRDDYVQTGSFGILEGEFVLPNQLEGLLKDGETTRNGNTNTAASSSSTDSKPDTGTTTGTVVDLDGGTRDNVILDDLIVDGSACVGLDCVNGESFGFDTLRLKENNLRIKFQDTSSSASFPGNDWQITANDSSNGGANKFSIDDIDGGKTPFTILAGAPNNSLYVNASGNIGIGNGSPVVEAHITDGDSPTLRLEQDGSSGFTPQTWDIAGNETNFFVRDVTNGSQLPFKIVPGADHNALYINSNNNIGMGTASPSNALHIRRTDATAGITVEEASSTNGNRTLFNMTNNGGSTIEFNDSSDSTNNWTFNADSTGFGISRDGSGGQELQIRKDGRFQFRSLGFLWLEVDVSGNATFTNDLTVNGMTVSSDRNLKEEFEVVDTQDVLEKLADMPITTWKYKRDEDTRRHIGPMAQDFHEAFGLGKDEKSIYTVDSDGVALAAIQGLNLKVEEKQAEIDQLQDRIANLEALVNALVKTEK